jgi:hypothetical protein
MEIAKNAIVMAIQKMSCITTPSLSAGETAALLKLH